MSKRSAEEIDEPIGMHKIRRLASLLEMMIAAQVPEPPREIKWRDEVLKIPNYEIEEGDFVYRPLIFYMQKDPAPCFSRRLRRRKAIAEWRKRSGRRLHQSLARIIIAGSGSIEPFLSANAAKIQAAWRKRNN